MDVTFVIVAVSGVAVTFHMNVTFTLIYMTVTMTLILTSKAVTFTLTSMAVPMTQATVSMSVLVQRAAKTEKQKKKRKMLVSS
jgi:uncharacterized membrane protein